MIINFDETGWSVESLTIYDLEKFYIDKNALENICLNMQVGNSAIGDYDRPYLRHARKPLFNEEGEKIWCVNVRSQFSCRKKWHGSSNENRNDTRLVTW